MPDVLHVLISGLMLPSAASRFLLPAADCQIYVFHRNAYEEFFRTPFHRLLDPHQL